MSMEHEVDMWEQQTLNLLHAAQVELARQEQRFAQVVDDRTRAQRHVEAIQDTLEIYRSRRGRPAVPSAESTAELSAEYESLNPKQTVERWADTHDGLVVMTEMTGALAAAGLFTDKRTADGVLYPVVRRGNLYEKVRRGVYRKRPPVRLADPDSLSPASLVRHIGAHGAPAAPSPTVQPKTEREWWEEDDEQSDEDSNALLKSVNGVSGAGHA